MPALCIKNMDRLFQNYEGAIESLNGISFSEAKAFTNESDGDVILIWLKNSSDDTWYRIFIDGAYCGVDKYQTNNSNEDLDEDIKVIDHTNWFQNKTVLSAVVSSTNIGNSRIILTLIFSNSICQLICKNEDGDCYLNLGESSNA